MNEALNFFKNTYQRLKLHTIEKYRKNTIIGGQLVFNTVKYS